MNDLGSQTGLTYSTSSAGMLNYDKDSGGNPIISKDVNGNLLGCQEGRNIMINAISNTQTAKVSMAKLGMGSASVVGGYEIYLNVSQINGFINNSYGVDNRTLGWGMTFMHETVHSALGGGLTDPKDRLFGLTGATLDRMNIVRAELNAQGGNYGQRLSYVSYSGVVGSQVTYLPFNQNTYDLMMRSINPIPTRSMKYIICK